MLRSKFDKFLECQLWNDKSIPLKILYLSSVSCKITPPYFVSSNNIYFTQKEPIKVKIFETFECSGQNLSNSLCQFLNKSIPLQILYPNSVLWKIIPLYFFSSNNMYFTQNGFSKVKSFETFTCLGQNLSNSWHVNFEMASQFLFKFCIILYCHDR